MRFASIVGARPQFVKVAVVSRALRQQHEELIIHTGQHYDYRMSAQFFDELDIPAPAERLLQTFHRAPQSYALVTVHRAVNADNPEAMRGIADGLNRLEMPVIFPVHPRTRARLEHYAITWEKHVHLMEPVGYLDMMALGKTAYRILTDSGGLQKEAFLLGVPCATLREETEWIETVETGWNVLVGTRWQDIVKAVDRPRPEPPRHNPFGEGDAAIRIAHSW